MCEKRGDQIRAPGDQLVFRHVIDAWVDPGTGHPSSQGFRPTRAEDAGCLSVDRATMTTAEAAFVLCKSLPPEGFGNANAKSTWAVSLTEVAELRLTLWADPVAAAAPLPANPAHAVIDFEDLTRNDQERLAKKLKAKAIARGCRHPIAA
jgi:hypothetical protein